MRTTNQTIPPKWVDDLEVAATGEWSHVRLDYIRGIIECLLRRIAAINGPAAEIFIISSSFR